MGCEESMMEYSLQLTRKESTIGDEDTKLELCKVIERQRGDVFELYHFSRVVSRGTSIIRQVMERNSRLTRICKIKNTSKQMHLIRAFQEVQILKNLNHPNIVQIVQYFSQHSFLHILMEAIPGKSICTMLCEELCQDLSMVVDIIRQILIALRFCHHKGYAHKAVNPQHVMLVRLEKKKQLIIKLVGFGKAHRIGAPNVTASIGHTSIFNAPEACSDQEADKQDIWGCGIIFLELLSGERNFPDLLENIPHTIKEIVDRLKLTSEDRTNLIDIISRMLEISPTKRISAEAALNHKIFKTDSKGEVKLRVDNSAQVLRGLMRYRVQMNLKALFGMYASLNILSVEKKIENLIEFYNLDKNKDGKIDFKELVESIENTFGFDHQTAVQHVMRIFADSNKSHENCLQFHEYVLATSFMRKEVCEKTLVKVFDELDTNKDKVISFDELRRSVEGVNLRKLLKDADKEEITFGDFRRMMFEIYQQQNQAQAP